MKPPCVVVPLLFLQALALPLAGGAPDRAPRPEAAQRLPLEPNGRETPLRERQDPDMQAALQARVNAESSWRALARAGRMSVGLVDFRDPGHPRYAAVNGDTMMYAASLPKIAILLAAFQAFEDGRLRQSAEVVDDLAAMIQRSDNPAATRMVDRLGLAAIARTLTAPAVRLYDAATGGGLWVGRAYAQDHAVLPDPLKGLLHAATAYQVCRFYYLLANGQLVSSERSAQMLAILAGTTLTHKFVYHLKDTSSLDHVYRKSGTWRDWHADSALVWQDDGRRYILTGLVEDAQGEQILRDLLPAAEEVLATTSSPGARLAWSHPVVPSSAPAGPGAR
jgi:beta-lactamase class A